MEIGRGGFGIVYAALDLRNGRSVAIKEVSLHDIDKEELISIEVSLYVYICIPTGLSILVYYHMIE